MCYKNNISYLLARVLLLLLLLGWALAGAGLLFNVLLQV
jgi:hypothetical protein